MVWWTGPGWTDKSPRPVSPLAYFRSLALANILYLALKKSWYDASETELIFFLQSFVTNWFL